MILGGLSSPSRGVKLGEVGELNSTIQYMSSKIPTCTLFLRFAIIVDMNEDELLACVKRKTKFAGIFLLIVSVIFAWILVILNKFAFVCLIPKYCQ